MRRKAPASQIPSGLAQSASSYIVIPDSDSDQISDLDSDSDSNLHANSNAEDDEETRRRKIRRGLTDRDHVDAPSRSGAVHSAPHDTSEYISISSDEESDNKDEKSATHDTRESSCQEVLSSMQSDISDLLEHTKQDYQEYHDMPDLFPHGQSYKRSESLELKLDMSSVGSDLIADHIHYEDSDDYEAYADYDYDADSHHGGAFQVPSRQEEEPHADVDYQDLMNKSYYTSGGRMLMYQEDVIREHELQISRIVRPARPTHVLPPGFTPEEMALLFEQVAKAQSALKPVDWGAVSKISEKWRSIERGRKPPHIIKDEFLLRKTRAYRRATSFNYGSGGIVDMAFKPSTLKLAVASLATPDAYNRPGNLLLCDLNAGSATQLRGHTRYHQDLRQTATTAVELTVTVNDIKLSHSERFFISGADDDKAMIWDAESGKLVNTLEDYTSRVTCIAVMREPRHHEDIFATCSAEGLLNIYSLGPEGQVIAKNRMLKSQGGRRCVSSMAFGYGHFWDVLAAGFDGSDSGVRASALQGQVVFYEANTQKPVVVGDLGFAPVSIYNTTRSASCVSFSRTVCGTSGRTVGDEEEQGDGIVRIFDVKHGKVVQTATSGHIDINLVEISPCENYVISCSHTNEIAVFDRRFLKRSATENSVWNNDDEEDEALHRFQHERRVDDDDVNSGITSALWWPQGLVGSSEAMLMTGGGDGAVKLWDLRKATEDAAVWSFNANLGPIARMTASPSWEHLIVGGDSGTVGVYTMDDGLVTKYDNKAIKLLAHGEDQELEEENEDHERRAMEH
ncbi:hypothetical protein BGZ98_002176 [Dissophora globulifera]|nr:hypothetical protein BGZ98_002176 [Dissophora globulifera]